MVEVIWTEPALLQLNEIAEYIALDNKVAAKALVQKVFAKAERLGQFPESGRVPAELTGFNYREILVNPCRLFYKAEQDKLFILYVMRQERDLRKFMLSLNLK